MLPCDNRLLSSWPSWLSARSPRGLPDTEPGFTALFNGKNLDGSREANKKQTDPLDGKTEAYKGRFKVEGGMLVIDPAVKGDAYIEYVREFGKDVMIKLEFEPGPKCNNDLFVRGTKFDIVPGKKENEKVQEGCWHTLEIVVKEGKVEHKIDGATVRTSKAGAKATPFKLRAEFGAIRYKNLAPRNSLASDSFHPTRGERGGETYFGPRETY